MPAMIRHRRSIPASSFAFAFLAALSVAQPSLSQGIKRLGDYGAWSAFQFTEKGKPACYIASQPKKAEGKYKKRGDVYAIVTHRPAEKRRDEVSILAGYAYEKDSWVEVTIGKQTFKLFTQDDGAWAPDPASDKKLVKAMIKGSTMVAVGTSSRGTKTKDTYSLSGFTKAYKAINKACGL